MRGQGRDGGGGGEATGQAGQQAGKVAGDSAFLSAKPVGDKGGTATTTCRGRFLRVVLITNGAKGLGQQNPHGIRLFSQAAS